MKYSVKVTDTKAVITEDEKGRYSTDLLAIKAIIRAAKDTDITVITVNGNSYNIMDEFTGGLLRDSQIIFLTTGVRERDPSLITRALNTLSERLLTLFAAHLHRASKTPSKPGYRPNQILDSTLKGPFDARLEPISYRSIERRIHNK